MVRTRVESGDDEAEFYVHRGGQPSYQHPKLLSNISVCMQYLTGPQRCIQRRLHRSRNTNLYPQKHRTESIQPIFGLYKKHLETNIGDYTKDQYPNHETQTKFDEEVLQIVQLWVKSYSNT